MAVGKGFFDQYSVFCVFGSVVGCVVVPLITQSVESVIFSAIVISLTATHLTKRATKSDNTNQVYSVKEVDKRSNRKAKDRDAPNGQTKKKRTVSQQIIFSRCTDSRRKREDLEKLELVRQEEMGRKLEEKKERKMKKKEERMKKKEHEKEEKEREDKKLKKLKEERLKENLRQQEKIASQKQESLKTRASTSKKSDNLSHKPVFQPVVPTIISVAALSRERSLSECSDTSPSPPPSVWKVPEYVEPKWNPGSTDKRSKNTKLNNDIVCKKSKVTAPFNQLYNPVHNNQSFCKNQYMNQEKESSLMAPTTGSSYTLLKDIDKPDNRQHVQGDSYSSFSGLPDILSQLKQGQSEDFQVKSYSLFGSDQPDSSVFRSPLTGL